MLNSFKFDTCLRLTELEICAIENTARNVGMSVMDFLADVADMEIHNIRFDNGGVLSVSGVLCVSGDLVVKEGGSGS